VEWRVYLLTVVSCIVLYCLCLSSFLPIVQLQDCGGIPSSDDCVNATVLTGTPFIGSGNTESADLQIFSEARSCSLVGPSTKGDWYVLEGDGLCYNATTLGSRFDTILAVYDGEKGCEGLICLDENDDGGFDLSSLVFFETEPGVSYYILVAGLGGQSGPYRFSLEVS
jgi:hypothetical protein